MPRRLSPAPSWRGWGFTLIELLVTLAVLAILLVTGIGSFSTWIRNAQVRTVADSLDSGIRLAQAESVRRNRQVVFSLTNGTPSSTSTPSAVADGTNWMVHTVPLLAGEQREFIRGGSLSDGRQVTISGLGSICFNSLGRLVANATPGLGVACTVNAAAPVAYLVQATGADRPLKVTVSFGGQTRLCDPAQVLSANAPQGCPAP